MNGREQDMTQGHGVCSGRIPWSFIGGDVPWTLRDAGSTVNIREPRLTVYRRVTT